MLERPLPLDLSSPHYHAILPLVRLMVGPIFLFEGVQKFVYPAVRGSGRLESIGFPVPDFLGPFVGAIEVICGLAIIVGLFTRWAVVPTIIIMITAIITTKLPILFGHGFGPFTVRNLDMYGFLSMAHEIRTDWAMLIGSVILVIGGAGPWSLDARRGRISAHSGAGAAVDSDDVSISPHRDAS